MIHLKSIAIKREAGSKDHYPFSVPVIKNLEKLELTSPVTFFVGENGSGKSTLIEAVASAAALPTVGSDDSVSDPTLQSVRKLARSLRLAWGIKTHRGFFLRAEDFFGFAKRLNRTIAELDETSAQYEEELTGYARQLAQGTIAGQRDAITSRYGEDLDANSHGESFLKMFQTRFVPKGLYLLDEPEAPLSPQRQLSFLAMMKDMVSDEAQFVIATHSPIIMAFPKAKIYVFDDQIELVDYEDTEHVSLTRSFLSNPDAYLRRL